MELLDGFYRYGVDHPSPSSAEVKKIIEVYLYSSSWSSWSALGRTLPFLVYSYVSVRYNSIVREYFSCYTVNKCFGIDIIYQKLSQVQ
jgi:hypothetical protein